MILEIANRIENIKADAEMLSAFLVERMEVNDYERKSDLLFY